MEGLGWKLRIAAVLCLLAAALYAVSERSELRVTPLQPPVSSAPPPAAVRLIDLDRLYDLDYLILEGGPPSLELVLGASVALGPPPSPAVPEPAAATLWILGFVVLYTLYLPARSW